MAEDSPKKELVARIAENQLTGQIPQKTLGRVAGQMPADRFTEALDGLVDEGVLGPPTYDIRKKEIKYAFDLRRAREKEYL